MAPSLTAAPTSSAMLSLLCSTSVADTMTMNAGSVTLACFRPAGKTVTWEDAAAAACLEAALYLRLGVLPICVATGTLVRLSGVLWECRTRGGDREPQKMP